MKKWCGLLFIMVLFTATFAHADGVPVTMTLLGETSDGLFNFQVTENIPGGITYDALLICWSETDSVGSMFNALRYPGNAPLIPGPFNETATSYNEIAWLAGQFYANLGNAPTIEAIQNAIWCVAGTKFTPSECTSNAGIKSWVDKAVTAVTVNGFQASSSTYFYIPVDKNGNPVDNGTQPMVGNVPEPGSLALLGTGIFGIAGTLKRKFMR